MMRLLFHRFIACVICDKNIFKLCEGGDGARHQNVEPFLCHIE